MVNREIKFRAWNERRWLADNEWGLTPDGAIMVYEVQDDEWVIMNKYSPPYKITPMQYTGLKDKNSKEIYEGDAMLLGYGRGKRVAIVEYSPRDGAFVFHTLADGFLHLCWEVSAAKDEVIGNIYENPELLANSHEGDWACPKCGKILVQYSRPELSPDRIDVITESLKAVWLAGNCIKRFCPDEVPVESLRDIAHEILKLVPEPELKVLDDMQREETRGKQASMDAEQFLIDIANKTGQKVAQSQNAQTRQDTLREFGKWLDKYVVIATEQEEVVPGKLSVSTATYGFHTKEWHELLDSLKRGEMPEQSGTKEMR